MRILIAEDDSVSRSMLCSVLERLGYEVLEVENGLQACEVLQGPDAPPIAILDWMMPVMSGVEVCQRVHNPENTQPLYVIILTARRTETDVIDALDAGADGFLTKPVDPIELRARIGVGRRIITLQQSLASHAGQLQKALNQVMTAQADLEQRIGQRTLELSQANLELQEEMASRVKAEEERNKAQAHLQQAQKLESVGRLAAGIAHEINTPIQFLDVNLKFLQKTYSKLIQALDSARSSVPAAQPAGELVSLAWIEKEIPKVLSDSMEGIDHVARIVRALKDLSHPGSPEPVPVDLNHCLETAVTVSRNEWKHVAQVTLDLAPDLPRIQGFAAEMNQVFLELIINAAQAIKAKAGLEEPCGKIHITTARLAGGAEIRIRDTGTGIAIEDAPKVFDPFFTTKEVGVGSGQGLMVSYQTVTGRHGGRIFFETQPGEGTTFIIQFPLQAACT